MQPVLALQILGILLLISGAALLPPLGISLLYADGQAYNLATMLAGAWGAALVIKVTTSGIAQVQRMRTKDGFLVVAILWIFSSLLSSGPFIICLDMSAVDAVFEATSAFTTTGATVILGIDTLPHSLLFYRQELQWLGGIGVIVSAIALFPLLDIGGMQLYKAETPGPMKEEKLTPRIANTARAIWLLYGAFTALCALAYWWAGMSPFDAVAHSFATVSTGGFSTHDASFGYWNSPLIEAIANVFMLVGAINFSVHFQVVRRRLLSPYLENAEVRSFLIIVAVTVVVIAAVLYHTQHRETVLEALRYSAFTVVSVITSTGFGIDNFSQWPLFIPILLIFVSVVGGCAGSTSGGIKVIRLLVLGSQARTEVERLIHPKLVRPVKIGGRVIPDHVIKSVWSFMTLYVVTFALIQLVLMLDGSDPITAFGAVAACLNNLGPGLGEVSSHFADATDHAKWLLSFAMLLGRLEIFTLLVLLSPSFWRP